MGEINRNLKNAWMRGIEAIGKTASNIASNTRYKVDEMNLLNRRREILNDFGAKAYALWEQGASFPDELEKQLSELKEIDETLNDLRAARYSGKNNPEAAEEAAEAVMEADSAGETSGAESKAQQETGEAAPAEKEDPAKISSGAEKECSGAGIPKTELPTEPEAPLFSAESVQAPASEGLNHEIPVIRTDDGGNPNKPLEPLSTAINDLFEKTPSVDEMAAKVNQSLEQMGDNLKRFTAASDQESDPLTETKTDDAEGQDQ